jgi:uncharacterized membrane protein
MKYQIFDMAKSVRGWLATAFTLLVLDVLWLGSFAQGFYAEHLGTLLRPEVNRLAAGLFYLFYVTISWGWSVRGSESHSEAWKKGASLGFVCYGVYELTNWAVIAGWPAILIPVDWAWGVFLTGTAAGAGYLVSGSARHLSEAQQRGTFCND